MPKNTPSWLKNAVIYEIYTTDYSESGTFDGVYNDLERIKELGVDIIWFMPIHPIGVEGRKGTYGSPYAIKDYRKINPDLGDEESFKKIIEKAHSMGMKVMIDVVYNHTARDSKLLETHPEWFCKDEKGNVARKFEEWSDVYDLDYSDKGLWEYQIESLKKWSDLGVDGFRCDVAPMVPLEFWKEARKALNQDKEVIWLAESVHKSFVKLLRDSGFIAHSDTELHEAFDLTYDYDGYEYLQSYFRGQSELRDYINHLFVQETLYPNYAIKMRFIENHDNQRSAAIISDKDSLKNWAAFYCLLPGATLVYAGQEIMDNKWPNFFEKEIINWEAGDYTFYEYFKKIIKIAKTIKQECSICSVEEIVKGIVKITWKGNNKEYVAILNLENRYGEIDLDFNCSGKELVTGECREISGKYKISKQPLIMIPNFKP